MGCSRSRLMREPEPELHPPPGLFVSPPGVAQTSRMLMPAYERTFGKLSRRRLFEDYFNQAGSASAGFRLKPPQGDRPDVNFTANISTAGGEAMLRWQSDPSDDPRCFLDYLVSTTGPTLQLRSYASFYGLGTFGAIPLVDMGNCASSDDYGVMGLRCDLRNLSVGASFLPFSSSSDGEATSEIPCNNAWLVGRIGDLSAGVQYKPLGGSKQSIPFENLDLKDWNCAISYGVGSTSPLNPLFNFSLELIGSTQQLISSFYHHQVLRHDRNATEYIDVGLEMATRVGKNNPTDSADNSLFQIAACWQASDILLVKGKIGPSKSSIALAHKPRWNSLLTFSATAVNDHSKGTRAFGFAIHAGNL